MDSDHIDSLLERYLSLLDDYTSLRESLRKTQTELFQNLARANFSAERGVRYGPDYYDDRMQATRILSVSADEGGCPRFETVKAPEEEARDATEADESTTKPRQPKSRDPLGWFGILVPPPLRQAQSHAVSAVETAIPRLVTIDAEMKDIEIRIRRARKKRAKAAASKGKHMETASQPAAAEAS